MRVNSNFRNTTSLLTAGDRAPKWLVIGPCARYRELLSCPLFKPLLESYNAARIRHRACGRDGRFSS